MARIILIFVISMFNKELDSLIIKRLTLIHFLIIIENYATK